MEFEDVVQWLTYAPVVLCSVAGLAIFLAKWRRLRKVEVYSEEEVQTVFSLLSQGRYLEARKIGKGLKGIIRPVFLELLMHAGKSRSILKEKFLEQKELILQGLERYVEGLSLIATLGPLCGLFGTVVGIVLVFNKMTLMEGMAAPHELAGGIGVALYTTLIGLFVGILSLIGHHLILVRILKIETELSRISLSLLDLLSVDTRYASAKKTKK